MIDEVKKRRMEVKSDEIAGPFLSLPLAQLASVREVLDRHGIRYWPDSFAISLDHKPPVIVINFDRRENAVQIQALLDEAGCRAMAFSAYNSAGHQERSARPSTGEGQSTMIDQTTKSPLQVKSDVIAGPFLRLPLAQLASVRKILDSHGIYYWVDSEAISLDGKPPVIFINFGRKGDAAQIQAVLDEAG